MSSHLRRVWRWLIAPAQRGILIVLIVLPIACGVVAAVVEHQNQVERHQRNVAIALAIKVQHVADAKSTEKLYLSQIASCERGISIRNDLRTSGKAYHLVGQVFEGFFGTAIRRAEAQSKDPSVSLATRAAAKAALPQYRQFVRAVGALTKLPIPPKPKPCDQVITDPNAPVAPTHH